MKSKVYSLENGEMLDLDIVLEETFFQVPYDNNFMSMYFARMKKKWYQPTNKTKNISEISGTTKKPYKQKHTGNARQGSTRSAQMRGGAVAFGPRAVKANIKIPKNEAVLAKMMLLSEKLRENKLFVVQKVQFNTVKTAKTKSILSKFSNRNVVIISSDKVDANSLLSVRNLKDTKIISYNMLTASDLFYADAVLLDMNSVNNFTSVLKDNDSE